MKRFFLYTWLGIILSSCSLIYSNDLEKEKLLEQLRTFRPELQQNEAQLRSIIQDLSRIHLAPHEFRELEQLLKQKVPVGFEKYWKKLNHLPGQIDPFRLNNSNSTIPVTKYNNQALTPAEKTVMNQVMEDFQVNYDSGSSAQYSPVIAVDGSGNFVVVWEDGRDATYDIYGQRYSSSGAKQGTNFLVNNASGSSDQYSPAISVDGSGNFVVVWEDDRNGNSDIYGQRYSSSGAKQGTNFLVNDASGLWQDDPAIAVDGSGNFVVVWTDERNGNYDIYGQRYSSSGANQGTNFLVNDASGSSDQYYPAIAVDGSGNFVVVWMDDRNGNSDIYGQQYSSSGAKQGTNFLVNDDGGSSGQYSPAIAVDGSSNFVVVWTDRRNGYYDIYGQRYSSNGANQGTNFLINDDSWISFKYNYPAIAADGSGNFMVVWFDYRNGKSDIYGQRYSSSGAKQGTNFLVNDDSGSSRQYNPAIAVDGSGNFVVVWFDERNGNYDIYGQRYSSSGAKQGTNFLVNDDSGSSWQDSPAIAVDGSGNFVVVWRDERNGNPDIYGQRYSSSGAKQGTNFLVNDNSGSSEQYAPAIAVDGSGNFEVVWRDSRNGNYDVYGQRYSNSGTKQGTNFLINDDSGSSDQSWPAIAVDGSGNFVVVWHDYRNGNPDIYGQRYSSSGAKQGSNFLINAKSGSSWQDYRAIAVDGSGNFVVVWEDYRNGKSDIYGQRYSSSGAKQGTNFLINDASGSSRQYNPAIAVDGRGNFVVVWDDARNGNPDIYGQRYSSSGANQGANFLVNDDSGSSSQYIPAIAVDGSGNFVIVWTDLRNGDQDIYAQLYDKTGQKAGTNYRVNNDNTPKSQYLPDVKFKNGLIYYCWTDNRVPGQGWDIFARIDQAPFADSLKVVIQQVDPINFSAIAAYVSVQTKAGASVENLTASNFKVWEDSTPESPITVTPFGGGDRANIPILMNYSGSMTGTDKTNMETAARTFIGLMGAQDQVAIFKFGTVVQKKQGLTTDKNLLYQAINSGYSGGTSTAFYDAVYAGLIEVANVTGRKAVLALTDGIDNASTKKVEDLIAQSKSQSTPVFTIGLGSVDENVLKNLATQTGGLYFYAANSTQLNTIYQAISKAINNQYLIKYTTHNTKRDGTWRVVDITATANNQSGTNRSGYFAPLTAIGDSLIVTDAVGGVASTNNKISIRLVNQVSVRGVQFDLKISPNRLTYISSQITSRTSGFTLSTTNHDSFVTCVFYHPSGTSISKGNAAIIDLFYNVSALVQVGDKIQLKLSNVIVADESAQRVNVALRNGTFTVMGLKGDVNNDGVLNVLDVVLIVDFIVGRRTPITYQRWAADCNNDNTINIQDIVLLIRWINGLPLLKLAATQELQQVSTVEMRSLFGRPDQKSEIKLKLQVRNSLSGFQIKLNRKDDAVTFNAPAYKPSLADFQIQTFQKGNEWILIGYSATSSTIEAGTELEIAIPVVIRKNNGTSDLVELSEIIFADEMGEKLPVEILGAGMEMSNTVPDRFELVQNYPNPFNPETRITYALTEQSSVSLIIYDVNGKEIRKLFEGNQAPGHYSYIWDAKDENGYTLPSGLYFYQLRIDNRIETKKMLLLK